MATAAKGAYRQARGGGAQLPTASGVALAPVAGVANIVGLGGIFQALQAQTATWFENTRRFNADASRFRAYLTRDVSNVNKSSASAQALLKQSLTEGVGSRTGGQRDTLSKMLGGQAGAGISKSIFGDIPKAINQLGFSAGDIARLATTVAQSGLEGTGADLKGLGVLSGALERGFNLSAESQSTFFAGFGRNAGAYIKSGVRPAEQAAKDLKLAVAQTTSGQGAALMTADIPAFLQEMTTIMRADARQGIKLASSSVLDLGQTLRDESSRRELFQGFGGIEGARSIVEASKGVMSGQGAALDQAMFMRQAIKAGGTGASLFDTALMLEEGGKGGEQFARMFEGYLQDLRATVSNTEERKALAVMLQQQGGVFGNMGLRQILSLLEGGSPQPPTDGIKPLTDKQIMDRGKDITDPTQKSLAGLDRSEVGAMQKRMATRVEIMKLESEVGRGMAKQLEDLEKASVNFASNAFKNLKRMQAISDIMNRKTSGVVDNLTKIGDAVAVFSDIVADTATNQSTLTATERAMLAKKRKARQKKTP